ncbi:polyphosphate--glucose phosphotransferase [Mangrovactinospora gilvigrisea]|uniref:polyphosphate--glucose phosphotransferase n=1 Tax=Mangrovactinospora gilvigrisea TaxID=1428644 RepID=UPI0009A10C2D|nr:ROK family protein [Mangrovactinospora gilvigrisea]
MAEHALGIDIGGSGIKGAPVDLTTGELTRERVRIPTPQPSRPHDVADVVRQLCEEFAWTGPVGITFPAVVLDGHTMSAANVDKHWIGTDARGLFAKTTGLPCEVVNDADAAGMAEVAHGAARGAGGVVLLLTFGTGIGSALFTNGQLVPNTEFGHIELRGKDAEKRASSAAKEEHDLSWHEWAGRVEEYLLEMEKLLSPELFVVGGGVSKKSEKFLPLMTKVRARVVPAAMRNNAGIVGAALAAPGPNGPMWREHLEEGTGPSKSA